LTVFKINEELGKAWLIIYKKTGKGFVFKKVPIEKPKSMKNLFEMAFGIRVVINKRGEIYKKRGVIVSIEYIPKLGKFLVVQSKNKKIAEDVAKKLGAKKFITKGFDKLMLEVKT